MPQPTHEIHGTPLPCVVYACDQGYAEPLAASLQSVIDTWNGPLPAFRILDCGLERATRTLLLRAFQSTDLVITPIDVGRLTHLPMLRHFGSPASFARLLVDEYVDRQFTHALYLDADTLAVQSLAGFDGMPLQGAVAAAAPEMYSPIISNSHAFPHYAEFNVSPYQLYFNSGVLIVDLQRWRTERCGERVLRFIEQHQRLLRYPDQDALNVVLGTQIMPLDPAWNCGWMWDTPDFEGYRWYGDVPDRAFIRHFMGEEKPWLEGFPNSELRSRYQDSLARCGFANLPNRLDADLRT